MSAGDFYSYSSDPAFLSGYLEEIVHHHREQQFPPTKKDLDMIEEATKILRGLPGPNESHLLSRITALRNMINAMSSWVCDDKEMYKDPQYKSASDELDRLDATSEPSQEKA